MKRSTLVLIAVLLVLVGVFWSVSVKERKVKSDQLAPLFDMDSTQVSLVRLVTPDDSVTLERRSGEWYLTKPLDYRASQSSVEELVGSACHLIVESLVSDQPEKHAKLQVDSTGTAVTMQAGTQTYAFVVGKPSSDYRHSYVRKQGANEVYLVKGVLGRTYNRRLSDWRDRTILDLDQEGVQRVTVFSQAGRTTLARQDTGWTVESDQGSFQGDGEAVGRLLSALCSLKASDFRDKPPQAFQGALTKGEPRQEPDFSTPEVRAEIMLGDGTQEGLSFVPEDDKKLRYLAKKDADDTVFVVYKGVLTPLVKQPDAFRKVPAEGVVE